MPRHVVLALSALACCALGAWLLWQVPGEPAAVWRPPPESESVVRPATIGNDEPPQRASAEPESQTRRSSGESQSRDLAPLVPPTDRDAFIKWVMGRSAGFERAIVQAPSVTAESVLRDARLNPLNKRPNGWQRQRLDEILEAHNASIEPLERQLATQLDESMASAAHRGNVRQVQTADDLGRPAPEKIQEVKRELEEAYGEQGRDFWQMSIGGWRNDTQLLVFVHRRDSPEVFVLSDRLRELKDARTDALRSLIEGM